MRGARVCLGGTFHPFHVGHEALLREAARDAVAVFVGVTDGALAKRGRRVPSWRDRAATVAAFWKTEGFAAALTVRALTDGDGPAASGDYDAIVVSPETRGGAARINHRRVEAGLAPLVVRSVPHVLAGDLLPVSATRVATGDIDRNGLRLTPVRVAVGSANPVKVEAVRQALQDFLAVGPAGGVAPALDVRAVTVASGVPEQPRGDETLTGARNRARQAAEAWSTCDYAIGIEAGLEREGDAWFDVQTCVVRDASGAETVGRGPAFQYPDWLTARALDGETVSGILAPIAQDARIGGTTGAIGFLTDGILDRTGLTRVAVLMACVPRIRRALYTLPPDEA